MRYIEQTFFIYRGRITSLASGATPAQTKITISGDSDFLLRSIHTTGTASVYFMFELLNGKKYFAKSTDGTLNGIPSNLIGKASNAIPLNFVSTIIPAGSIVLITCWNSSGGIITNEDIILEGYKIDKVNGRSKELPFYIYQFYYSAIADGNNGGDSIRFNNQYDFILTELRSPGTSGVTFNIGLQGGEQFFSNAVDLSFIGNGINSYKFERQVLIPAETMLEGKITNNSGSSFTGSILLIGSQVQKKV